MSIWVIFACLAFGIGVYNGKLTALGIGVLLLLIDVFTVDAELYENYFESRATQLWQKVLVWACGILALVVMIYLITPIYARPMILLHGVSAQGTLMEKEYYSSRGPDTRMFKLEYQSNGENITSTSYNVPEAVFDQAVAGQKYPVHYFPWFPKLYAFDNIAPADYDYFNGLIFLLVFLYSWAFFRIHFVFRKK